jgi:hypothetical protein
LAVQNTSKYTWNHETELPLHLASLSFAFWWKESWTHCSVPWQWHAMTHHDPKVLPVLPSMPAHNVQADSICKTQLVLRFAYVMQF